MVIVNLSGGLGNQMFQYAAARRLAWHHNTEIKVDLSPFKTDSLRKYELHNLNANATIASPLEVIEIVGWSRKLSLKLLLRFRQIIGLRKLQRSVFREKHFHFDPALLSASNNIYLEGFWQSEKYFKDIERIIRREFVMRDPVSKSKQEIINEIMDTNSVSLHVRRGDYLINPRAKQLLVVCDAEYYLKSVEIMSSKVERPHFYIFSDDIKWAKENIIMPFKTTFVGENGPRKSYEDLRLMSLCKHNIIANSSFSWWGAWLNENPNKIVIAPKQWFRSSEKDTKDLIPESWLKI